MDVWNAGRERMQGSSPYPHVVIDNFLPDELVDRFLEQLGDDERIYGHKGWGGNRVSAMLGTRGYRRLLEQNEAFREIHAILNSRAAIEGLYRWCASDLPRSGL